MTSSESADLTGVRLVEVGKRYEATSALSDVTLRFAPGRVHGLVGHNGSGKSTLVKILSGAIKLSTGRVEWDGHLISIRDAVPAVHQNLALAAEVSALENFGVTAGFGTRHRLISWRSERHAFTRYADQLGVDVDPTTWVGELPPVQRASVAIMRALRSLDQMEGRSRLLLLDEVTTFYSETERGEIARLIHNLQANDVGVVFISHHLEEVLELADEVTVLKDGRVAFCGPNTGLTKAELITTMFGHADSVQQPAVVQSATDASGVVWGLGPVLDETVRQGEILGLTGRAGMGHEILPYDLHAHARALRAVDDNGPTGSPAVSLVPADRSRQGVWTEGTIFENLTLSVLSRFGPGGNRALLNRRKERRFARDWLSSRRLRARGEDARISELSGGNQQKVLVGRALLAKPDVLILHEPTQGIDALARDEIFETIRSVAAEGTAVVLVTSEVADVVSLADRVIVYRDGAPRRTFIGSEITEHSVVAAL
jgi:ribose transport system ATP-binding protein